MQELINSLLQYSRVTSKAGQLEQVDLTEVVNGVLDDLALRIKKTGAAITITDLPVIEADPVQMRQLFQNLIANSLKYHRPDATPEIRISAQPAESTSEGVDRIQITVQDNGIGFDPQFKDRIFNIFERLPEGSAYHGSGIGLSICQTIVERHNGSITADSHPGQGAEFRIILPLICC
jgi:signal transduction histidine kinase